MNRKWSASDFLGLSPAERIDLVEQIWDSLADSPDLVPLTDDQRTELDARLERLRTDPIAGSDWASARARIEARQ